MGQKAIPLLIWIHDNRIINLDGRSAILGNAAINLAVLEVNKPEIIMGSASSQIVGCKLTFDDLLLFQ
jgi:hypothetical protein